MKEHICDACQRSFTSAEAIGMHDKSKHPEQYKKPLLTIHQRKKTRNWVIAAIMLGLLAWGTIALLLNESPSSFPDITLEDGQIQQIPPGAVHWHPNLEIIIDGKKITIPSDLGYGTGKTVDTHLSGMRMSPIHTHESTGKIHLENSNPSSKPETVTLGYLFYVWEKEFNKSCIFEYCTDTGTLTMTVNGQESAEFEKYIMHDNDDIKIEYASGDE